MASKSAFSSAEMIHFENENVRELELFIYHIHIYLKYINDIINFMERTHREPSRTTVQINHVRVL
jgi:hypothetical protein